MGTQAFPLTESINIGMEAGIANLGKWQQTCGKFWGFYDHVFQYMSTNGDGTGTTNANGDYSIGSGGGSGPGGAGAEFFYQPPSSQIVLIERVIIYVEDAAGMRLERYGTLAAALTEGVELKLLKQSDDSLVRDGDFTAGKPIKSNGAWTRTCYDANIDDSGPGNDILRVRWTLSRSGIPVLIDGSADKLSMLLSDNFTGIVEQTFMVQGFVLYDGA